MKIVICSICLFDLEHFIVKRIFVSDSMCKCFMKILLVSLFIFISFVYLHFSKHLIINQVVYLFFKSAPIPPNLCKAPTPRPKDIVHTTLLSGMVDKYVCVYLVEIYWNKNPTLPSH